MTYDIESRLKSGERIFLSNEVVDHEIYWQHGRYIVVTDGVSSVLSYGDVSLVIEFILRFACTWIPEKESEQ